MDDAIQKILEIVTGMQEDITVMKADIAFIKTEVQDIRSRLEALEAQMRGQGGFAKEIDMLMNRVGAIERHLGIKAHA